MGFFSWITRTRSGLSGRSICNRYSDYDTFTVYMISPKEIDGQTVWEEEDYDGYGVFGGKDFYVLLAEINGLDGEDDDEKRTKGIEAYFDKDRKKTLLYPILTEDRYYSGDFTYEDRNKTCDGQGYWYSDEEANDYDFEWCPYISESEKTAKSEIQKKLASSDGILEMVFRLPKTAGKKTAASKITPVKLKMFQIEKMVEEDKAKFLSYKTILNQIQ